MLHGIDHVVILVPELDAAVESYTRLGFTVVPGGRHNVATHNALIAFEDGAYIELIAFWEDAPKHRWYRVLALGGGLVDYCMRTDDLAGDVSRLRASGIAMSADQPMSRLRPDGYRLEWKLALATETQGVTPFLIEDVTPREQRVPSQTDHANGVTGISTLTVAVRDLDVPARLSPLLGPSTSMEHRIRYISDGHRLDFIVPGLDAEKAGHVSHRGMGGVFALSLKTAGPQATIDPAQSQKARLFLIHA
jgi:catechol 2,3-dioxygenase-like lactoylglutathione lyase family enzyme